MRSWKLSVLLLLVLLTVMSCGPASSPITTGMPTAITEAPTPSRTPPPSSIVLPADPPSQQPLADTNATISFTPLIQGVRSGGQGERPSLFVAQDDNQRTMLTAQLSSEHIPGVNAVDLSSTIIVAAFEGLKPTSGYQIEIVTIQAVHGVLTVAVNVTAPAPGDPVRQGFEMPYHLVQISRDQLDPAQVSRYQLRDAARAVLAEGAITVEGE